MKHDQPTAENTDILPDGSMWLKSFIRHGKVRARCSRMKTDDSYMT